MNSPPTRSHFLPPSSFPVVSACEQQVTKGEDDAQGTYEDVLRLVLTELEGRFLRGDGVHAVAAQLLDTLAKRLDVVESFSSGHNRLADLSKHMNLLCFMPLPEKRLQAFMQSWKDRETLKNTLTIFWKSSALWPISLNVISCIVPSYFHHFLEIPAQSVCIPRDLIL